MVVVVVVTEAAWVVRVEYVWRRAGGGHTGAILCVDDEDLARHRFVKALVDGEEVVEALDRACRAGEPLPLGDRPLC